jgi:hypothetical protein
MNSKHTRKLSILLYNKLEQSVYCFNKKFATDYGEMEDGMTIVCSPLDSHYCGFLIS